jgi:short-subunit dehydrogenase
VLQRSGRIDVLVNNAGVGVSGAAEESSIEQARALFETNLFGSIRTTRAVLPHMREQGSGRIINVSSVLGFMPAPFMALYAATKQRLSDELCVRPGRHVVVSLGIGLRSGS